MTPMDALEPLLFNYFMRAEIRSACAAALGQVSEGGVEWMAPIFLRDAMRYCGADEVRLAASSPGSRLEVPPPRRAWY